MVPQTSVPLGTRVFLEGAIQFGATEALVGFSPRLSTLCPAKCAQLLVSIKHRHPEDQDAEGFQKVLHFGTVAVGCTAERQIKLYNPSAVCVLCPWWEVGAGTTGLGVPNTHPCTECCKPCIPMSVDTLMSAGVLPSSQLGARLDYPLTFPHNNPKSSPQVS